MGADLWGSATLSGVNTAMAKIGYDRDWIQQQVLDGKSNREIGEVLGLTGEGVAYQRRKLGIQQKPQDAPRIADLDEAALRQLYEVERLSQRQIAARFGILDRVGLRKRLRKFRIPPTGKWQKHDLPVWTQEQHDIIVGCLLGDACIPFNGERETTLWKVAHSHHQHGYTAWIHDKLKPWSLDLRSSVSTKGDRVHIDYAVALKAHPRFQELRKLWYRDDLRDSLPWSSLKAPPIEVFQNLSDLSLACWYFDDGHLDSTVSIVSYFPLLGMETIVEALQQGTGFTWRAVPRKSKVAGSQTVTFLRIPTDELPRFFGRIVKYATPDLAYKFPQEWWSKIPGTVPVPTEVLPFPEECLAHYSVVTWKQQDPETQNRWIDEVFDIYRKIGFPYPKVLPRQESARSLQVLQDSDEKIPGSGYVFVRSQSGLSLCSGYMPHRFGTLTNGGHSAVKSFECDVSFRKILTAQFQSNSLWVKPPNIRSALACFGGNRTPANFRPSVMKALVDRFVPDHGVVWDPCAGFGGRLLGCVASMKHAQYIGTEPSPQTVVGLNQLWEEVSEAGGLSKNRVAIIQGVAERDCPPADSVDFVFTSPPYFTTERYVGGDQSHILYPTIDGWTKGFLTPLCRNAYTCIRSGGFFGINIADVRMKSQVIPLVSLVDETARACGFRRHEKYWYALSQLGKPRPCEYILIYQKGGGEEPEWDLQERYFVGKEY